MDGCRCGPEGDLWLEVHAQPGARRSELAGLHGGRIKIRLAAPPVDGQANKALQRFIADWLECPLNAVILEHGHTHRFKRLRIHNAGGRCQDIQNALNRIGTPSLFW
jgi:uncharacterized protein